MASLYYRPDSEAPVVHPRLDRFLDSLATICSFYGVTIAHEDGHGNFRLVDYDGSSGVEGAQDRTSEVRQ